MDERELRLECLKLVKPALHEFPAARIAQAALYFEFCAYGVNATAQEQERGEAARLLEDEASGAPAGPREAA